MEYAAPKGEEATRQRHLDPRPSQGVVRGVDVVAAILESFLEKVVVHVREKGGEVVEEGRRRRREVNGRRRRGTTDPLGRKVLEQR